jgi:hypothetical protein
MIITHRRAAIATVILGVLVAGCGGGPRGPNAREAKMYMDGLEGRGGDKKANIDYNAVYATAMALKAKGDCTGAVPKLRQVAALGPGYEGAQTALGECLLQGDTAELTAEYQEGLTWLWRAADSGWPEAQAGLAYAYALGPKAVRNTDEAAYWLALYRNNTGKARIGFTPPPADRLAAIDTAIPATAKAAGGKRAETWQRKVWLPPNPPKDKKADAPKRHRGIPMDDEP